MNIDNIRILIDTYYGSEKRLNDNLKGYYKRRIRKTRKSKL